MFFCFIPSYYCWSFSSVYVFSWLINLHVCTSLIFRFWVFEMFQWIFLLSPSAQLCLGFRWQGGVGSHSGDPHPRVDIYHRTLISSHPPQHPSPKNCVWTGGIAARCFPCKGILQALSYSSPCISWAHQVTLQVADAHLSIVLKGQLMWKRESR